MATRRTNQRVTLLMLVLVSVTVITLDYHGEANRDITRLRSSVANALSPLQRGVAAILHPLGDVVAGSFEYGKLQTENERLRDEIGSMRQQVVADDLASSEARELLSLDKVPFVGNVPTVTAVVISPSTSNFEDTIELDVGTSSGVGPGMAVVGADGLVGTVEQSSPHTSTVLLITDPRSSGIGVAIGGSSFVAAGAGSGRPLSLAPVGQVATPHKGELVTTSGASYPSDIPVAIVTKVSASAGDVVTSVSAKPATNLSDLEFVKVLLWLPVP